MNSISQYSQVRVGMRNVRLGCETSQHVREPGLREDYMEDM